MSPPEYPGEYTAPPRGLLEWYDRATESETLNRQRAERSRIMRQLAIYRLHEDGATMAQIEALTGLTHGTCQRMIAAGKAHAVSLDSQ